MLRKKISPLIIFLFTLLALPTSHTLAASVPPRDLHVPISGNKIEWLNSVCQFMTEGGCAYFLTNEADSAWFALKDVKAASAEVHFKQKITPLIKNLELWKVDLTLSPIVGKTQLHEVYATFRYQDGSLLLDRIIMFDQTLLVQE